MNAIEMLAYLRFRSVNLTIRDSLLEIDAPKGVIDQTLKSCLSEHKQEIISILQYEQENEVTLSPLSHGQRALWYTHQLDSEGYAYNVAFATRIFSSIDGNALQRCGQKMLDRHPVLRTTFSTRDEYPIQVIHTKFDESIEFIDAKGWPDDLLIDNLNKAYRRRFDLENGPIFRITLFQRSQNDSALLISLPHIAVDGWSLWLLLDEIQQIYQAEISQKESLLPTLHSDYTQFVSWQRQLIQSNKGERLWTYWNEKLRDVPVSLDIPSDYPRPPVQTYHGSTCYTRIDPSLFEDIQSLCKAQGVTLYVALLAAFQVLIHRYSAQDRFLIGSPLSGRGKTNFENLVGYFVNPLVIPANFTEIVRFVVHVRNVQQKVMEALDYQDYPFPLLVERMKIPRDASRSPLFQVSFVMQRLQRMQALAEKMISPGDRSCLNFAGMDICPIPLGQQEGLFDLTMEAVQTTDSILIEIKYNTDLFKKSTIERMLVRYQNLLKSIVKNPEFTIDRYSIVLDDERKQILSDWNDTVRVISKQVTIVDLFETVAFTNPNSIALIYKNQTLSYAEVKRKANQLANYLKKYPISVESIVGVCLDQCIEIPITILAIFQSSAAYLPIDPSYPKERIQYILNDAKPKIVITHSSLRDKLPNTDISFVEIDRADWEHEAEDLMSMPIIPNQLAYIIYTSGSTGKPKGVLIEHKGLTNLVKVQREKFDLHLNDRVLQFASIGFDASIAEILDALTTGAALCMEDRAIIADEKGLIDTIDTHQITNCTLPPSLLAILNPDHFPSLRTIVSAGEECSEGIAKRWSNNKKFINAYGPTEYSVCTTINIYDKKDGEKLTIGKPIDNIKVYILDPNFELLPIGVPGELYIQGIGEARGYLHHPEQTGERFLPNPYGGAGERMYRTGDLARWRDDGEIEFLGRLDDQVKLRGFRIELGEIEAALREQPGVRDAVAALRDDEGRKRLAAYVVMEAAGNLEALKIALRERLPDYMIPSALAKIDRIPLTPNGKVDRRALPAPSYDAEKLDPTEEPRTGAERILARIWRETLPVERIGIHDNFFDRGGDSILSIQILARAAREGLHFKPQAIFQHQTVAALAAAAQRQGLDRSGERASGAVYPTPIQCWFYAKDYPDPHHWNQGVALRLRQALDCKKLEAALRALVVHHDGLRLRARQLEAGEPGFDSPATAPHGWTQEILETTDDGTVEVYDLNVLPAEEKAAELRRLAERAQAGLDLQGGPLLRAAYVRLGEGQPDRLILAIHHLLVDGVSWRILLDDLQTAYRQAEADRPIELPPKTTALRTWALRLRDYAATPDAAAEIEYWRETARRETILPVDCPGGSNTADSAQTVAIALSADETKALLHEIPKTYKIQITDALLAALAQTVAAWTNDTAGVRLDLESHGREPFDAGLDLSRTVGWFTALYPVWLTRPTGDDPGARLRSIRAQRAAIPRNGFAYGLLRWLHPNPAIREEFAQMPESRICLNYLGQFDALAGSDSLFEAALDDCGAAQSPRQPRAYELEINGGVMDGRLSLRWTYSGNRYRRETIERLAAAYKTALREFVARGRSPQEEGLDPADFPDANLTAEDLAAVLRERKVAAREIESIYPLTPLQEGMLFHTLYDRGEGAYVVQAHVDLIGDLEAPRFHRAWQETLDRHPVLRSEFLWENRETPLQLVRAQAELTWIEEDWRERGEEERERQFAELLAADRQEGFALDRPPLMRMRLIRLGEKRVRLLWSLHHLLLDGWSMARVLSEVGETYQGRAVRPSRPFVDYVRWLKDRNREESRRYWETALSGFEEPTRIDLEKPTGAPPTYAVSERRLSRELTEALKGAAKENQITLNSLMQGAWFLLMGRCGGGREVTAGVTESGRPESLAGVNEMVGMFINTLPARATMASDATLADWLRELQSRQMEVRAHQYDALTEIQRWAKVPARTPLFETIFIFENYPTPGELLPGLRIENAQAVERTGYPLTAAIAPGDRLSIKITYDGSRYEGEAIERLQAYLETLLRGMASGMGKRVGDLSLLTEEEYRTIVEDWNRTERPYAKDRCIHQLFEEQVARTPEATAVRYEGRTWTYAEFDGWVNRLARRLRREGVKPDARVGLCVERSWEMAVGLYAILKAGGAYVPLDPSYPAERLSYMAEDAGLEIVVTQEKWKGLFAGTGASLVALDDLENQLTAELSTPPPNITHPANLAYLIYTSGSTGQPKGCMITHQSLVNYIEWVNQYYFRNNSSGNFGLYSSLSFDLTVTSIFSSLTRGKSLTIFSPAWEIDEILQNSFDPSSPVDIIKITPAHCTLLDRLDLPKTNIQIAIVGGEQLTFEQIRALEKLNPNMEIYNEYGPTEGTVGCIAKKVTSNDEKVVIGKPIDNSRVYILDEDLKPCPVGVAGELYIGGDILSLGYINKPDLTSRSFITNPFRDGEKIYKTGDIAAWQKNGEIECFGRNDDQVKIRGFRIDLGEIETLLLRHPKIQNAVMLSQDDSLGAKRLIAYYVENEPVDRQSLRIFLAEQAPDYMIPSVFVRLESFPLTRNGKIDRRALPKIEDTNFSIREYYAPKTPVEELIANIWSDVLRVKRIGRNDNFFELGGHSLLATQALSRIRKVFAKEFPLRLLFESPTVCGLASTLERLRGEIEDAERYEIVPVNRSAVIPLSFAQQRLWFLDQLEPGSTVYNVPGAIRLRGRLDRFALEKSIGYIVRRHEILRARVQSVHGEPYQIFEEFINYELPVIDLQKLSDKEKEIEIRRILIEDNSTPFDLAQDRLMRAALICLEENDSVLLLNFHHIVSDGWSVGVFVKELTIAYRACIQGSDPDLAPLPIQYADFAVWQRKWLNEERLSRQLDYWKTALQDLETLPLRTDFSRPPVQTYNGAFVPYRLETATVRALETACLKLGITPFMFLLAAFQILLSRLSGQDDIAVGIPISGRNHVDIENLIGFFVNTLVLRANLAEDPTTAMFLEQIRNTTLDAFSHPDVPFERLVDSLQPDRDRSRSPLFQVMFSLQDWQSRELSLPELQIEEYKRENAIAKFDLTISLVRNETGIGGAMEYNTDLFSPSTIERWLGYLTKLIEGMISMPTSPISQLKMISEEERNRIVGEWNQSQRILSKESGIQVYLERQAAQRPNAIALVYEEQTLTYDELNRRANRVAHFLIDRGVQPGQFVGICFERSFEMVIALYAAIKAGAAYVPLDPEYPKDRLGEMVGNLSVILTMDYLRDRLPDSSIPQFSLDSDWDCMNRENDENPSVNLTPDFSVYVLFTSGSSGRPKGVVITHGALINHMLWYVDAFSLQESDAILQKTVFTFDSSVCEFFAPFMAGARLVLARRAAHGDWRYLIEAVQRYNITLLQVVPTVLELLAKNPDFHQCHSLRVLISGGEALSPELAERVAHHSGARLFNLYGPTEVTIDAAYRPCEGNEKHPIVPIGRPIWNIQTYILDRHCEPVPPGVPGELYLGGIGLAMGYIDQTDITAERFVPNPFPSEPGERMYRTGDLARFTAEGEIEYLGRIDQQVKIRGNRIELGDIEAVLRSDPSVKEAVAHVWKGDRSDPLLAAYVTAKNQVTIDESSLFTLLRDRLPSYMIPSSITVLPSLPVFPSGKINRRALPIPMKEKGISGKFPKKPSNEIEEEIVSIWKEVLQTKSLGVDENFFEIGGHSIKAVTAVNRIQERMNIQLPLSQIFQSPTIEKLAVAIDDMRRYRCEYEAKQFLLFNESREKSIFCFPPLLGYGFAYKRIASGLPAHTVYAFDFLESDSRLQSYTRWIQELQPQGNLTLLGYSAGGNLAFETAKELEKLGRIVSDIILLDSLRVTEKRNIADRQIKSTIQENMEYFSDYLMKDDDLKMFVANDYVRVQMASKMRSYLQYLNNTINNGKIAATIHWIKSIDQANTQDKKTGWPEATQDRFLSYQGFGRHGDMVDDAYVEKNAALIESILNR